MYTKQIDNFSLSYKKEAYLEIKKIEEELKNQGFGDDESLDQCLDMLKKLRDTMINCSGYLESFMFEKRGGEPDEITVKWAEKVLHSLWKFEYSLLEMYVSYSPDPDALGKIIPVHVEFQPGMITVDIDTVMPHKKKAGLRSSSLLSYILDESFRFQIGTVADEYKLERAYIFIEHHTLKDTPEMIKRYPDSYDTNHLLVVISEYFLQHGAGPEFARIGKAVIEEERKFTRVKIAAPEKIKDLLHGEDGFFQWNLETTTDYTNKI